MKSKKSLQKVLCIALATASISSAVVPVSYGVGGGFGDLDRDTTARLLRYVGTPQALRNLVGTSQEMRTVKNNKVGKTFIFARRVAHAQRVQEALAQLPALLAPLFRLTGGRNHRTALGRPVLIAVANVLAMMWPDWETGTLVRNLLADTEHIRGSARDLRAVTQRLYTKATNGKQRSNGEAVRTALEIDDAATADCFSSVLIQPTNYSSASCDGTLAAHGLLFDIAHPDELVLADLVARECLFALCVIMYTFAR
ncbi:hypothetical protein FACS1894198_4460 [Clostridia bacterium]|nr:hypothetical protein FACS1894198_4460 [Clostridia bacterium]